jgi:hypothetical protein
LVPGASMMAPRQGPVMSVSSERAREGELTHLTKGRARGPKKRNAGKGVTMAREEKADVVEESVVRQRSPSPTIKEESPSPKFPSGKALPMIAAKPLVSPGFPSSVKATGKVDELGDVSRKTAASPVVKQEPLSPVSSFSPLTRVTSEPRPSPSLPMKPPARVFSEPSRPSISMSSKPLARVTVAPSLPSPTSPKPHSGITPAQLPLSQPVKPSEPLPDIQIVKQSPPNPVTVKPITGIVPTLFSGSSQAAVKPAERLPEIQIVKQPSTTPLINKPVVGITSTLPTRSVQSATKPIDNLPEIQIVKQTPPTPVVTPPTEIAPATVPAGLAGEKPPTTPHIKAPKIKEEADSPPPPQSSIWNKPRPMETRSRAKSPSGSMKQRLADLSPLRQLSSSGSTRSLFSTLLGSPVTPTKPKYPLLELMPDPTPAPKIHDRERLFVQAWQIVSRVRHISLPNEEEHILYGECMHAFLYMFNDSPGAAEPSAIKFLWIGKDCRVPEKEGMEFARLVGDQNADTHVIHQGSESALFVRALGGVIVTRSGERRPLHSVEEELFCIRSSLGGISVDQVNFAKRTFCSGYSYVVKMVGGTVVWHGNGSLSEEIAAARRFAGVVGGEVTEIMESDPGACAELWTQFEQGQYASGEFWRRKYELNGVQPSLYVIEGQKVVRGRSVLS